MKQRKGTKVNLYQIIGMILLCISLIVISYNTTMAWFMDESVASNGRPNVIIVGTVDLDVVTNFNFYNLALAPDTTYTEDQVGNDIGTYIKTSSENDVLDVYVRIKYTCNRSEVTLFFEDDTTTTNTHYNSEDDEGMWYYCEEDNYYYYLGGVSTSYILFNAGYTVDNSLNNSKANAPVSINLQIEAIQKPYGAYWAVWDTSPDIFDEFALLDSGY